MTGSISVPICKDKPNPRLQIQASAHKSISFSTEKVIYCRSPPPLLLLPKVSPASPPNLSHFPRLDLSCIYSLPRSLPVHTSLKRSPCVAALPTRSSRAISWAETWHHVHWDSNLIFTSPPSSWINAKGNARFGSQVSQKKSYSQSAGGGTKPAY